MDHEPKGKQTNILLRPEIRRAVERRAEAERRSLSNYLANVIEDSVASDTGASASAARSR
jgi:hypothetical protein